MSENKNLPATTTQLRSLLGAESTKKRFSEILGKKSAGFISSIISAVNGSAELQRCVPETIIGAAAIAASLDLPIVPGLGFAGLIPFKNNKKDGIYECQFQVMKKGYIQLAQRSGQVKLINACPVYEGQLKSFNQFTGEFEFQEEKTSDKIIGYSAFIRLINGFEKYKYMTIDELVKHAKKYSSSFRRGSGKWADKTDGGFEQMCEKTVLKLLLAQYATLSVDMQNAMIYDQAAISEVNPEYVDNEKDPGKVEKVNHEKERLRNLQTIEKTTSIEILELMITEGVPETYDIDIKLIENRIKELKTGKSDKAEQGKIYLP